MEILNRDNTKGNLTLYKKLGNKQLMQNREGSISVDVHDLFIELSCNPKFWKDNFGQRYGEWFLVYPEWHEPQNIYNLGIGVSPNYWRENGYLKTKQWAKKIGWDLYHMTGAVAV